MRRFSLKPAGLVGLSIQPENIHLIQLKKSKKSYLLERVRRVALPPGIFAEGKIIAFEALQGELARLVSEEGLQALQAAVCVPASQVKMQRTNMPADLSDDDIEAEITAQVYRSLPGKGDALCIDFQRQHDAGAAEVPVFFVAARSEYVHRYAACLQDAGVSLAIMDIDVFALLRAARHALKYMLSDNEKMAVLYFGHDYGVMVAGQGPEIIFHQQWDGQGVSPLAMPAMQWVEWCCHAYRQAGVTSLAIGGNSEYVHQSAKIISENWPCKIYEVDPFAQMMGLSGVDNKVLQEHRSAFLLASGLAMRESLPWLR